MTRDTVDADTEIVPLRNLSRYKVAEGDADVRGWDVFDRDGARLGTIDDLLVDTAAEEVRYLAVRLSPEWTGTPQGALDALDTVPAAPLTGMAALGTLAGQGIAGNPVTAGLPGMIPGLGSSGAVLGEPVGPFGLGTATAPAAMAASEGRRVLIPVSQARLDRGDHRVVLEGLRGSDAAALPPYAD